MRRKQQTNKREDRNKRNNIDRLKNMDNLPNTRKRQAQTNTRTRPQVKTRRPTVKTQSSRKRKVKKKNSKSRTIIGRMLVLITFIIGTVYVIGIVVKTNQKPMISYQTVQRGVIDNSVLFNGLVVRDEVLIKNKKEGNLYLIAAEGDKVRKNGQVYQILTGADTDTANIEEDINKVESDIEKVQTKRKGVSYYQNEIQEIDNSIENYINDYYMTSQDGYVEDTHILKNNLEYELDKKKNIHMKDNSDTLTVFQEQKQDLTSKLLENQHIHTSPESGIVSYYTDSNEDVFTIQKLREITEDETKARYEFRPTNLEQIIKQDQPAYKLIKSDKWYVVSFISEEWAENFQVGKEYEFVLIDDKDTMFTLTVIDNIEEEENNRIIFASREQLDEFADKRSIDFKSKQHMYEGLKLPVSAVAERNMIKVPSEYIIDSDQGRGVFKTDKTTKESKFISLDIQYEDDNGFSHMLQELDSKNGLTIGDIITSQAESESEYEVSDIEMIRGVYVVNGRITKFKQIKVEAQNQDYIIANPNTVQGLKPFDQIVTNPKNTKEKQLLRDLDVKNSR